MLRALTLAPTYMSHQSWLVVARDLYPERLPGDEPEELEVVPWKLQDLDQLMLREDFSEGRSLAALFIAREWLNAACDLCNYSTAAVVAAIGTPTATLRTTTPGWRRKSISRSPRS